MIAVHVERMAQQEAKEASDGNGSDNYGADEEQHEEQ
jgi:hypothetical protein